jgi:hypothetical protein
VWNKRDGSITNRMRAIIDEQVSLVHIRKPHIGLTKWTRLDSLDCNAIVDLKEISKHIAKSLKIHLSLR